MPCCPGTVTVLEAPLPSGCAKGQSAACAARHSALNDVMGVPEVSVMLARQQYNNALLILCQCHWQVPIL